MGCMGVGHQRMSTGPSAQRAQRAQLGTKKVLQEAAEDAVEARSLTDILHPKSPQVSSL